MYNTGEMRGFSPSMLEPSHSADLLGVFGFGFVALLALIIAGLILRVIWEKLNVQS